MQQKIQDFKQMTLKEQKEILLIVMEKAKEKSEGLNNLYNTVLSVDISNEFDVIKEEFIKIYTFLMEAVDYIKSQKLKESMGKLDTINRTLNEMREKEKKERESEFGDYDLDNELNNL